MLSRDAVMFRLLNPVAFAWSYQADVSQVGVMVSPVISEVVIVRDAVVGSFAPATLIPPSIFEFLMVTFVAVTRTGLVKSFPLYVAPGVVSTISF